MEQEAGQTTRSRLQPLARECIVVNQPGRDRGLVLRSMLAKVVSAPLCACILNGLHPLCSDGSTEMLVPTSVGIR
jgi:hypothetical protein